MEVRVKNVLEKRRVAPRNPPSVSVLDRFRGHLPEVLKVEREETYGSWVKDRVARVVKVASP
jgi:hypothetical protein